MFWRVSEVSSEDFLDLVGVVGGTTAGSVGEEEEGASVEERRAVDSSIFMASSSVDLESGLSSWREREKRAKRESGSFRKGATSARNKKGRERRENSRCPSSPQQTRPSSSPWLER